MQSYIDKSWLHCAYQINGSYAILVGGGTYEFLNRAPAKGGGGLDKRFGLDLTAVKHL